MQRWLHRFFSFPFFFILLCSYGFILAIATFLENDFGTSSIKALVYHTWWFDSLHVMMGIQLLGMIVKYKMWKREKLPMFFFHGAFIVILLGAGVTRYFGFEGMIHIREGKNESRVLSSEPYIQINVFDTKNQLIGTLDYQKYFSSSPFGSNGFSKSIALKNGKSVDIALNKYIPSLKKGQYAKVELLVYYQKGRSVLNLVGGDMKKGYEQKLQLDDVVIVAEYGSKVHELPFSLFLEDFILGKYPGSSMPSHYESLVQVVDKEISFPYSIYMNHVLDYAGYRFFQSSYDPDELGTILSVNKDPGKYPTYFGYLLLTLSLFWSIFAKKSRVSHLLKTLNPKLATLFFSVLLLGFPENSFSQDQGVSNSQAFLKSYNTYTEEYAKSFESLLIQSNDGRIKPIDTFATDILYKLTKSNSLQGLSPTQVIFGMVAFPQAFQDVKMIKVTHPSIKQIIYLPENESLASYNDFFTNDGAYRLAEQVKTAHRKKVAEHNQFDKDILRVDERLSITYMVYSSTFLKIFPNADEQTHTWYAPIEAVKTFNTAESQWVQGAITDIVISFQEFHNYEIKRQALATLMSIKAKQYTLSKDILPSSWKIELEILYNKLAFFKKLSYGYILIGLLSILFIIWKLIKPKQKQHYLSKLLPWFLGISIVVHTIGLIARTLISGHAPWSDTYETMIFIALITLTMGFIISKKSPISASGALFMSGIILFGAHLSFIDPQITTLVPVLKSYWLNIHVSIITASYGFFTFSAFLGILTLSLFICRYHLKNRLDASIVNISSVNELSIIIGLALLTVGNFLGGVWANESWGRYWGWDPKETWALISIIAYTVIAHLRFSISPQTYHYWFAIASVIGIFFILMTYFGVNFYLSGLHSYGTGDPIPIPNELYVFLSFFIILCLSSYRSKSIKFEHN